MKKVSGKKFISLHAAKGKGYLEALKSIEKEKVCPLCPKTMKWHTKPILKKYKGWLITENFNPYENSMYHLLVIGDQHKEKIKELTLNDWEAITRLINWAVAKFKIKGGGMTMRFGNPLFTGATVQHLHAHLIAPKIINGKAKPVYFPIG